MGGMRRIGLLTGGGDCPGLNAVIRAVTKTALGEGLQVVGISEGFTGLLTEQFRELSEEDVSGILPRGGTILGASSRGDPLIEVLPKPPEGRPARLDRTGEAARNLERAGIEALFVVGGDGSQTIAVRLAGHGVPIVGIPKTIDNDLMGTDVSFGFDSALLTATEALDKLHTTAESHHRIMALEVMGREAGWIALMAGIAGGGDVILIPEIPFTFEAVAGDVEDRREKGKRFSIVVVAEGARMPDGETVGRTSPAGNLILGGIGAAVAGRLEALTGVEARVTVLGHLQRGGTPSPFDRILATRFGVKAVEMALAGDFGRMVGLHGREIGSVTLEEAVAAKHLVSKDGESVRFARAIGVSFGNTPA